MEGEAFDSGSEAHTPEEYEAIGRAAMGAIQGSIIGDGVPIEEYVDRADPTHRDVVGDTIDDVVRPLLDAFGKSGNGTDE